MPPLRTLAVLCLALASGPARAMSPEMDRLARQGQSALYALDFDGATASFERLRREYPTHPAGSTLLGATAWWRARYAFETPDAEASRRVGRTLREAVALAQRLTVNPATACEGRFYLGGALGILAHWELLRGRYVEAAKQGRGAVRVLTQLSSCTEYADDAAYGLGLYGYETSRLPWELRWLSKFVIGGYGNRKQALALLERAAERSRFMRTDAQSSLAYLYVAYEHDLSRSLRYAQMVHTERPESPVALTSVLEALGAAGRYDELLTLSTQGIERGRLPGSTFARETAAYRYFQGLALLGLRKPEAAAASFTASTAAEGRPIWITAAYLKRGCAYDVLGRRDAAKRDYRAVLARPDPWQQGARAKRYLKRPFRWEDLPRDLAPHGS